MLKAKNDGTFEPDLTTEEKASVLRAVEIIDAMAKVGLANRHAAAKLREFAEEHCVEKSDE